MTILTNCTVYELAHVANTKNFVIGRMHTTRFGIWYDTRPVLEVDQLWFEHKKYGDEFAGGLWFDKGEFIDYDGCGVLPAEILEALEALGFDCIDMKKYL